MVHFNEIVIEGFGSIVDRTIFEFDQGINILRGENGSGKTTLFNSILWCLFGETSKGVVSKKIPSKKEIRSSAYSGTMVAMSFEKDGFTYDIIRTIDYKSSIHGVTPGTALLIFEDDLMLDLQHIKDSQGYIETLLGINKKLFMNSVFFGQKTLKFMQYSSTERKQVFDDIFSMSFVDEALDKAKEEEKEINAEINSLDLSIVKLEKDIERIKMEICNETEKESTFDITRLADIEKHTNHKNTIQEFINKLEAKTFDIKEDSEFEEYFSKKKVYKTKKRDFEDTALILNNDLKSLQRKLVSLESVIIKEKCSECNSPLDTDTVDKLKKANKNKISEIQNLILQANVDIMNNDKDLVKHNNSFKEDLELEAQYTTNNKTKEEKKKNDADVAQNKMAIKSIEILIKRLEEQTFDFSKKEDLIEKQEKLEYKIDEVVLEIGDKRDELEILKYWTSKGFTAKGFKSYLLDNYLKVFNQSIEKYTDLLGVHIRFEIDNDKLSKPLEAICTQRDLELTYEEFSGGEATRIDVAVCFALNDILAGDLSLIVLDEIFEGLDDKGIEGVFSLLRAKESKQLYVTTHKDYVDSYMAKFIKVNKENGRSRFE
jgi:DNA repair protein SbcC/Rad50